MDELRERLKRMPVNLREHFPNGERSLLDSICAVMERYIEEMEDELKKLEKK